MPTARIKSSSPVARIKSLSPSSEIRSSTPNARSESIIPAGRTGQVSILIPGTSTAGTTFGGKGYPIGILLAITADRSRTVGGSSTPDRFTSYMPHARIK